MVSSALNTIRTRSRRISLSIVVLSAANQLHSPRGIHICDLAFTTLGGLHLFAGLAQHAPERLDALVARPVAHLLEFGHEAHLGRREIAQSAAADFARASARAVAGGAGWESLNAMRVVAMLQRGPGERGASECRSGGVVMRRPRRRHAAREACEISVTSRSKEACEISVTARSKGSVRDQRDIKRPWETLDSNLHSNLQSPISTPISTSSVTTTCSYHA
jgi:hypothetical protein